MRRFYDAVLRAERWIAGTFLVTMVVLIFAGGAARLAGHPQNWTTDFATCLFAWACFFCADIAWRRGNLMSIDLVVERLPLPARRAVAHANYAIITAFLVYGVVGGLYLSWVSRARSFQGMPEISYSWVTMAMPVGCLLLLVTTLIKWKRGVVA